MIELANKLINIHADATIDEIMTIIGTDNGQMYAHLINEMIEEIDNIELLKKIAVRFNGVREFLGYEDRLCELMGDDEYFDWSDENGIQ